MKIPILLVHDHGQSLHILVSSISFLHVRKLSLHKSFTLLVRLIPRFLGSCEIVTLISFSICLPFLYRKANNFKCVDFIPVTLLNIFIICENCLVDYVGSFIYSIISPSNKDSLISFFPNYASFYFFPLSYCSSETSSTIYPQHKR